MSALDELSPASFRGVPFQVEDEEGSQRRAVPVHEFAGSDRWETEDHGLHALQMRVTAYVARMEGVKAQSTAFWAACMAPGPGPLVLPHAPPLFARCVGIRRQVRKDKIGYVAFALEFVQASGGPLGLPGLLLPSQAASAALSLVSAVGGMLLGLSLGHRRSRTAWNEGSIAAGTSLRARTRASSDATVVAAGRDADEILAAPSTADPDRGASIADAFATVVDSLRLSTDSEAAQVLVDAASNLSIADLATAPLRPPVAVTADIVIPKATSARAAPRARSRQDAARVSSALRDGLRALAAAAYARRLMVGTYETREAAQRAREGLEALIGPLLDEATLDEPSFTALARIHGLAAGHLIDVMTTLKPIIRVETGKPLPATLLAWQLYGDTSRAGELVRRNGVATPCFMPTIVEAVAP